MKFLTALAAASLLTAGVVAPAQAAPTVTPPTAKTQVVAAAATTADTSSLTIGVSPPWDSTLETGQVATIGVDIDTPETTVVRFQQNVDDTYEDLEVHEVPVGSTSYEFAVPTDEAGQVTVRVALDESESFYAWTSSPMTFTVTQAPPPPTPKGPSTITVSKPAVSAVKIGHGVTVAGTVTGEPAGRTVRLELSTKSGWMPVATTTVDANGGYRVKVPTDWYYSGTLRASVVGTKNRSAASSATTFPMSVGQTYTAHGIASDYRLMTTARWNPCKVITYKVNTAGAPKNALAQVKHALAVIHQATGLRFSYAGSTAAIPFRTDNKGAAYSSADLTIAWGSERQVLGLTGWTVGLGGPTWSDNTIISGGVVMDRNSHLKPGFGRGQTWGALMLHEIGHAMGLDHAHGAVEVMAPSLSDTGYAAYQAGDLAGLRKVGAVDGCTDSTPTLGRTVVGRAPVTTTAVRR